VICDFVPLSLDVFAELLNAATGSHHTGITLLETGTRIANLARKYNLRNGRTYMDDTLPGRFFNETSLSGFMEGKKLTREYFQSFINDYYKKRHWTDKGEPITNNQ
jgi:aldehyde:ferredoxin oxidoreductase